MTFQTKFGRALANAFDMKEKARVKNNSSGKEAVDKTEDGRVHYNEAAEDREPGEKK